MQVRNLMSSPVHTLPSASTLEEIAREMSRNHVGAIILIDLYGQPRGIVTEKDVVSRLDTNRLEDTMDWFSQDAYRCPPHRLMTVRPDTNVGKAVDIMDRLNIRRLPVMEDGRLVGIITARDILGHCASLARKGKCPEEEVVPQPRSSTRRKRTSGLLNLLF